MASLRVGCAGWSYRDWVGPVYPRGLPPSDWLAHYATLFPFVEIDSTFQALPTESTVASWIDRVRSVPGFVFSARVSKEATHEALVNGRVADLEASIGRFMDRVVRPLEEARRLEALVVELPPEFAFSDLAGTRDTFESLTRLVDLLEPARRRVAIEFRHGSWFEHVGERLVPEVHEALQSRRVGVVHVDGLKRRPHQIRTAPWSYFRFHGRRRNIPASERDLSHAPYDYSYPPSEVGELATAVRLGQSQDEATFAVFNNTHKGQGVENAMDLLVALGERRPRPAPPVQRAARLDEFVA